VGKKKSLSRRHLEAFGLVSFEGRSRPQRRRLQEMEVDLVSRHQTIADLEALVHKFDPASFVLACCSYVETLGPVLKERVKQAFVGRLLWWMFLGDFSGTDQATLSDIQRLVGQSIDAVDPQLIGGGKLGSIGLAAIGNDQFEIQRFPLSDVYRSVEIFSQVPVGLESEIVEFAAAAMVFSSWLVEPRTAQETSTFLAPLPAELHAKFMKTLESLSLDLVPCANANTNPLLSTPILRLPDGRFVCPVPYYLTNAFSPIGLLVRGLAASKGRHQEFGSHVGRKVEALIGKLASRLSDHGWTIVQVDDRLIAGVNHPEHADFVLVAPDVSLAIVVESKATVQKRKARLGNEPDLRGLVTLYEKAFRQIQETITLFGTNTTIDLSNVPKVIRTFGLVVTMEKHLTVHWDGEVCPGLPIGRPSWGGARPSVPSAVVSLDEFESFVDSTASLDPETILRILEITTRSPNPGRSLDEALDEICPEATSHANERGSQLLMELVGRLLDENEGGENRS
jgi:hypothetical protein